MLTDDLAGHYDPVTGSIDHDQPQAPAADHGFRADDPYQNAAGLLRDWPRARGVFSTSARSFFAWVNEEDHLRLISLQRGADLGAAMARLERAMDVIDGALDYQRSDTYGFLASCPTNLGTGLRASFRLRLPLSGGSAEFQAICRQHCLEVRGSAGEHATGALHVYDISNKRRLGLSEAECLRECHDGVIRLIAREKSLDAVS